MANRSGKAGKANKNNKKGAGSVGTSAVTTDPSGDDSHLGDDQPVAANTASVPQDDTAATATVLQKCLCDASNTRPTVLPLEQDHNDRFVESLARVFPRLRDSVQFLWQFHTLVCWKSPLLRELQATCDSK